MKIDLTAQEAEHLLAWNTGYQSCSKCGYGEPTCEENKNARLKIEMAIVNERRNVL